MTKRITSPKQRFISAILEMSYGDMMTICGSFSSMVSDRDVRGLPKTPEDFASMLHDWAEAEEDA